MKQAWGKLNKKYKILRVETTQNQVLNKRLIQLGFIPGSIIEINHYSPWFKSPILVSIRGLKVAITDQEANLMKIAEVCD